MAILQRPEADSIALGLNYSAFANDKINQDLKQC